MFAAKEVLSEDCFDHIDMLTEGLAAVMDISGGAESCWAGSAKAPRMEQAKRVRNCWGRLGRTPAGEVKKPIWVPPSCLLKCQGKDVSILPRRPAPQFSIKGDSFKSELKEELAAHRDANVDLIARRTGRNRNDNTNPSPMPVFKPCFGVKRSGKNAADTDRPTSRQEKPLSKLATQRKAEKQPVAENAASATCLMNGMAEEATNSELIMKVLTASVQDGKIKEFEQRKDEVEDKLSGCSVVDICGFSSDVTKKSVMDYIESFGEVMRLEVVREGNEKNFRAWMKKPTSCEWIISCLDGQEANMGDNSRVVTVNYVLGSCQSD